MNAHSLLGVRVKVLDDSGCVLGDMRIVGHDRLGERVNDILNLHHIEFLLAFFVDAQVSDGEQCDSSWRLRRFLVVRHYIQELLQSSMFYQVSAEGVRVPHEVSKGSGSVGSGLLLLVSEEVHEKRHAGLEVLVEHIIVESSVSDCEASELSGVPVGVSAAVDGSAD